MYPAVQQSYPQLIFFFAKFTVAAQDAELSHYDTYLVYNPLATIVPHHIETSQLICN